MSCTATFEVALVGWVLGGEHTPAVRDFITTTVLPMLFIVERLFVFEPDQRGAISFWYLPPTAFGRRGRSTIAVGTSNATTWWCLSRNYGAVWFSS